MKNCAAQGNRPKLKAQFGFPFLEKIYWHCAHIFSRFSPFCFRLLTCVWGYQEADYNDKQNDSEYEYYLYNCKPTLVALPGML